ncbi:MAG: ATP-binding protein [Bacteroidales bacterium]|nr:ATP-binding protein [Bacteroidales bacterium]
MNILGNKIEKVVLVMLLLCTILGSAVGQLRDSETAKLLPIGDAFVQSGDQAKAIDIYKQAISMAKNVTDAWNATDRLVLVYGDNGMHQESLKLYDQLMQRDFIQSDTVVMMYIYDGIGKVYFRMGDYVKSIKSLQHSRELMDKTKYYSFKSTLYTDIAQTLVRGGDVKEAIALLDTAQMFGERANNNTLLQKVYSVRSELYASVGDYQNAYKSLEQHVYFNHEENKKFINVLMNTPNPMSTSKSIENEIKLKDKVEKLEIDLDGERMRSQKSSTRAYYVGLSLLFLIGVVIWLLLLNLRKKRRMKMLNVENDERQRVLSYAAQEFVTPFNQLICFAELQMQYAINSQNKELINYSRSMYNSSQQLYLMLGNVLAWSQIGGEKEIEKSVLNVAFHVERIVEVFQMLAESKNIQFSVDLDDAVNVVANESHFDTILRNLVSNAITFTHQGGSVSLTVVNSNSTVSIVVEDTGIGMDEARLAEIRAKRQIDPIIGTKKEKGTGLGLYISQTLAEANGGEIDIKSTKGVGTTAVLTLPRGE